MWYESYMVFASRWGSAGWANSGNSVTGGPPTKPGSSRDAIVVDGVWTSLDWNEVYYNEHAFGVSLNGDEAVKNRNENCVGYGDGHAEVHAQKGYFGTDNYFTWDGAKYVTRGPYRCTY